MYPRISLAKSSCYYFFFCFSENLIYIIVKCKNHRCYGKKNVDRDDRFTDDFEGNQKFSCANFGLCSEYYGDIGKIRCPGKKSRVSLYCLEKWRLCKRIYCPDIASSFTAWWYEIQVFFWLPGHSLSSCHL